MPSPSSPRARRTRKNVVPPTDPVEAARFVSLRYVSDAKAGITRRASGSGFTYVDPSGDAVSDEETLARIRALAIPPAWTDVWIAPLPNGHIQATGRDIKGRKQYRYHARWRAVRDETKYGRMQEFGRALPRIRARVGEDLARSGLPREKLLAMIVKLLETTRMRVGNEEYARANGSFGLTTLRNKHVQVEGATLRFRFKGKSGKTHDLRVSDRRLASLVRRVRDLPGQEVFQYLGNDGEPHPIDSTDVNAYLKEIAGDDFTAKDFRTWTGTLLAIRALAETELPETQTALKSAVLRVVEAVADELGNTPAVCRKSYIHPTVLEAYGSTELRELWRTSAALEAPEDGLSDEESALLRFLSACSEVARKVAA